MLCLAFIPLFVVLGFCGGRTESATITGKAGKHCTPVFRLFEAQFLIFQSEIWVFSHFSRVRRIFPQRHLIA